MKIKNPKKPWMCQAHQLGANGHSLTWIRRNHLKSWRRDWIRGVTCLQLNVVQVKRTSPPARNRGAHKEPVHSHPLQRESNQQPMEGGWHRCRNWNRVRGSSVEKAQTVWGRRQLKMKRNKKKRMLKIESSHFNPLQEPWIKIIMNQQELVK